MKKLLLSVGIITSVFSVSAQNLPVPSPKASVMQTIGLSEVTVTYSRPSANGRDIFGKIVNYGEMWRTGANSATTIKLTETLGVGETCKLEPGTYSIFTIPNEKEWVILFNKEINLWGTGNYKVENEVCKTTAKVKMDQGSFETFTIGFDNVTNNSAMLTFAWENIKAMVEVTSDPIPASLANIEKAVKEVENAAGVYNNAANFYIDFNLDSKKAVEYAEKAMAAGGKEKFWMVTTLSKAYAADKQYKKAIEQAEISLKMAKDAKYDPYITINTENIEKWKKM